MYAAEGAANRFSDDTKSGHYLFQGCINLAEATLQELHPLRGGVLPTAASNLALGCLSSTGITMLTLTQGFTVMGAHACDSCHLLKQVDLSNTKVEEIQEFTFAHCRSLKEVSFPPTLHTIRVKAFMNCAAFLELAIPPSLKHIGSGAFLDCTTLRRVVQTTRSTQMARRLCGRKCLCHLPRDEVAALAPHDPRYGIHLWSWVRRSLPDRKACEFKSE